jgi:hypothetical protein
VHRLLGEEQQDGGADIAAGGSTAPATAVRPRFDVVSVDAIGERLTTSAAGVVVAVAGVVTALVDGMHDSSLRNLR